MVNHGSNTKSINKQIALIAVVVFLCFKAQVLFSQTLQWAKSISTSSFNIARSIVTDASGNLYSTGFFFGTTDFDPGPGTFNLTSSNFDIFFSKLDASGNFLWAKKIGGSGQDYANSIAIDAAGNFYVTGEFYGSMDFDPGPAVLTLTAPVFISSSHDVFICKFDQNGNLIWAKNMNSSNTSGNSVDVDLSGNVYTTGYFSGTVDFDPGPGTYTLVASGNKSAFVSKLDGNGNFVWAKSLGGGGTTASALSLDANSNVYTAGNFLTNEDFDPGPASYVLQTAGLGDVYISKLDVNGNFVWAKNVGGAGNESANGIKSDPAGNVFVSGTFSGSGDFDPGAGTNNLISNGSDDAFILKLDNNGSFIWAQHFGGSNNDFGSRIILDANIDLYTLASFQNTVDLDPHIANTFIRSSYGGFDTYVLKLDNNGNFLWAQNAGGMYDDYAYDIAIDQVGSIYATGTFSGTVNFGTPSTNTISSLGNTTAFITKYNNVVTLAENSALSNLYSFPNPTQNKFKVLFNKQVAHIEVTIINTLGQKIDNRTYNSISELDLTINGASGLYFINITSNNENKVFKVIKE